MDLKQLLLKKKRFFDEEVQQYKGSDPLKIRCEFFSWLEKYSKEDIADIYFPLLEETLKLFMEDPTYKQDLRFVQMWLNYSVTQPNPADVIKNIHSRGLGTECAILYSKWAEQLIKIGSFSNADSVFRMGLNGNIQPKAELQKQYDEFLMDIGRRVLMGKIQCPKCGTSFQTGVLSGTSENPSSSFETVANWEWNSLKVGDVDDFECPIAYFEDPDPTKIRMYPKDKVYPGNGQEFSLEELLAEVYELRYREEEKLAALAKAKEVEEARCLKEEEEAKRLLEEQGQLRKREAEKLASLKNMNPPVTSSLPMITPKMLNLPKDMDNSLANSTTFTVHTKEAMNVVQDMWSSPVPSQFAPGRFQNDNPPETNQPPVAVPNPAPFEIYTEEEPVATVPPPQKAPFQIYDENVNSVPRKSTRSAQKPKLFDMDANENAPPGQEIILTSKQASALKPKTPIQIYNDSQAFKVPEESVKRPENQPKPRLQLFKDDGAAELAEKLESQARIQPPMFNVQDKNDDFSDITCNTKAFEFMLPSSTPLAVHKVHKPLTGIQRPEDMHKVQEPTNLSVILEQSKDRSGNSSAGSQASHTTKSSRSVPLLQSVPEAFDPFSSEVVESLLEKIAFPKSQHLTNYYVKQTNLPTGTKSMKLMDETFSIQGEIGKGAYAKVLKATNSSGHIVALKVEKPACRWEYYIAKEIQSRVHPKFVPAFMDISAAYVFNNGSILETPYAKYGTLITCINTFKEKTGKSLDLGLILHFSLELIDIVEHLHKCKIIHADLKPDNVVLRELPSHNEAAPCLQLIDFGRCLDMSLFPSDTQFHTVFKTEDNKFIEMKENKPWTYQIDLQGLASIFHILLFTEYMKVQKKNDKWQLQKLIPRNVRRELWNPIFESLLNVNPATDLPFNFSPMREALNTAFHDHLNNYLLQIKIFGNHIGGK